MKAMRRSLELSRGFLSRLVNGLISPHPSIAEVGMRRQAQFSAAIALLLSAMLFLQIITALATGRLELGLILGTVYGSVLLGYGLSRSRSPQWGSVLFIFGFTFFAFIMSGRQIADVNTTLYGMIPIAYVLAGVLLSAGWQIALVVFVLAGSIVLGTMQTALGVNMNLLGGNLVALGLVLIFTSRLRDGIERRRLDQVRQINLELEEAKIAVQESERKFGAFVEQSTDGLLLTDEQGIVIEMNLAHEKLTGVKRDEIIGQPIWEMLVKMILPQAQSPDTRRKFQEMIQETLRTGQGRFVGESREVEILRPDGRRVFILQTTFLIKTETGYRFGSISHDVTDRKIADEALRESESRFRGFIEKTSDGIMFFDNQGRVVEWNNAAEQMTGLERQQALGMQAWEIQYQFTPNEEKKKLDLERLKLMFHQTFETGSLPARVNDVRESRIQHMDGSLRIAEQRLFPIQTAQGFALGVVLHDITERKQVEALTHLRLRLFEFAAHHSIEELLQKTLDEVGELTGSPIGFCHFVEEDQKTLILQAWSTRTMKEFCQAEGKDAHYPVDQAGVWADAIRRRQTVIHNDYSSLPDRRGMPEGHAVVTRELVVPILRNDRIVAVLGVGNKPQNYTDKDAESVFYLADVTWELVERKQAEVALHESQVMLRLIFENAFDGISVYEEYPEQNARRLIDCNTRYAEIAGRSREELLSMGNTLPVQKNVDSSIKSHRQFLDRLSSGMYMGRFSWLRPDGKDNVVEYAAVPLEMDGRMWVIGVDRDITAQMQAVREREALIEKLEMQNAELERFNYTVSHDLKAPLVTIKGFLGYILEDAAAGNVERLRQDTQRIARAVDRMNSLLADLLEFSRVGRLINPAEDVPFETLAREAVEQVEERLKAGGIQLIIHQGLPAVHGDAHRLLEVLQNLIDNAAKFMGDQPEPKIEIGCKEQDEKHVFFVQDNGIGIDPRFHTQVFGLFNKLDPHAEGTGVGLALVKRIVEFHGGRIWVESEPGIGSTFFFTLPGASKVEAGQ